MLLNRSIKKLPPSRRHDSATIRLTDMIEWLGQRPPSKALADTIAHLTEARRMLRGAWSEFADLKSRDPEDAPPAPTVACANGDAPRRRGQFVRKEPTT